MSTVLEQIRRLGFQGWDLMRGQKVRKHYEEIKYILQYTDSAGRRRIILQRLSSILSHARRTVPYYSSITGTSGLADFPVVNKSIIREDTDRFISSYFIKERLSYGYTSGSTGTPFKYYQDRNKKLRNDADYLYFYGLGGYTMGQRLYFLRIWNDLNKKSRLAAWAKNLMMEDTGNLSELQIARFLNKLNKDRSDKFIMAYASSIETVCFNKALRPARHSPYNVKAIFTGAEMLTDAGRKKIHDFFGCPVYSRYSNQENGVLAQQYTMDNNDFKINTASYYIELLELNSDKHVKAGERGRIVITDLFNFGMPLIRYDTGDIGVLSADSADENAVFKIIEGKRLALVYNTSGVFVSPHVLTAVLVRYEDQIKQYQFIQQTADKYCLKLHCRYSKFDREDELLHNLKQYFGTDASIKIEYVEQIPLLKSGKRQNVVNQYHTLNAEGFAI